ncbi:MAG: bifunctional glutamate N-acetyltransferase/amino-acid acetyltransferase ArgJ [Candidatus Omnitrophota bacterium]
MTLKKHQDILPPGFRASGISSGIKKSGRKDLSLFISDTPCITAAMMTANDFKAAPLFVSARHLSQGGIRALIANSGNANCMTGQKGLSDAFAMAGLAAASVGLKTEEVLVASTGIIGKPLPLAKIRAAMPDLVRGLSGRGLKDASAAIMTTDTFSKEVVWRGRLAGKAVTISGTAKGAGMIAPRMKMGTMLAFCFTDARIEKAALREALFQAVEASFNSITIDGCMSTNDMALVMANGHAAGAVIKRGSRQAREFARRLEEVCLALAKMIVEDAEGATKFIEVRVKGARHREQARQYAFSVANSNLFKCAMFGSDPNWGRIASAIGSVAGGLGVRDLSIALNGVTVLKSGEPLAVRQKGLLKGRQVVVDIRLGRGAGESVVYTSDLSYDYVRINADYS